jgi:hypothetical protein
MLQALIDEMRGESWFPASQAMQEKLAVYVLKTYERGVTCPARLKASCAAAAGTQFSDPDDKEQMPA